MSDTPATNRPRDGMRTFEVPRYLLEDAIGLILAQAEERKTATETVEAIRKIIGPAEEELP